jgi:hypothetical protein
LGVPGAQDAIGHSSTGRLIVNRITTLLSAAVWFLALASGASAQLNDLGRGLVASNVLGKVVSNQAGSYRMLASLHSQTAPPPSQH